MNRAWMAALLVPVSFWDSFLYTVPCRVSGTPYWVHHRVVVMPKQYEPGNLVEIGRAFAKACGKEALGVLYMAPNNDVVRTYVTSGRDGQFENWRHRLELFLKEGSEPIRDIAQVNVVNGETVLRVKKGGKVSRVVLTGSDPLKQVIDGQEFEVLEIYGDLQGKNVSVEYLDGGMLAVLECPDCVRELYVAVRTTGQLSMARFQQLARRLSRIGGPADLHIYLRRDTWFVPSMTFAFLYAFEEQVPRLPSKAEYEAAGQLSAWISRGHQVIRYYEWAGGQRVARGSEPLEHE